VENVKRVCALFLEWKASNHCSAANRDIMVARRASSRQGAPENCMLGVFAASRLAYASIVLYHSAINISTAQEDVLCGDHNGVAPKRQ
jgi:hypothetical protein